MEEGRSSVKVWFTCPVHRVMLWSMAHADIAYCPERGCEVRARGDDLYRKWKGLMCSLRRLS